MTSTADLKKRMLEMEINPSSMQQASLDVLLETSDDKHIVMDPTNPFTFALEIAATAASVSIDRTESLLRKTYPRLARSRGELYNHMSDEDYLDRFATPSQSTTISLLLDKAEVDSKVLFDGIANVHRMTIPADTQWSVKDYDFYHHYPININKLSNGGYRVIFDNRVESPLAQLESNIIPHQIINLNDRTMILLEIPVSQITYSSLEYSVTKSTGFSEMQTFKDKFYYCRAYMTDAQDNWTEIKVTHSDLVYDPLIPTLVIDVNDGFIQARLPEVYMTEEKIGGTVRIDVFSTKGAVDDDLGTLPTSAYSAKWNNLSGVETEYVSLYTTLSTIEMFSTSLLTGGAEERGLEELRDQVIYNKFGKTVPIMAIELEAQLATMGYRMTKLREHILGRQYLASNRIEPANETIYSGMSSTVSNVIINPAKTDINSAIANNGYRLTLKPDLIYRRTARSFSLVSDQELATLNSRGRDSLVEALNTDNLFYSPFFTVIDGNNSTTTIRSYNLDKPKMKSRSYVSSNSDLGYVVSTKSIDLERVSDGYELKVNALIPSGLAGLKMQVFLSNNETSERWLVPNISSTVVGTNAEFVFNIDSTFDIDSENRIELTNLIETNGGAQNTFISTTTTIDIIYVAESNVDITSSFDNKFIKSLFIENVVGVLYETGVVNLGTLLENYYGEARAVLSEPEYDVWDLDEPLLYEAVVYQRDENGVVFTDDGAGGITLAIEHNIGDPVLDVESQPMYVHRAGDVKYFAGSPVVLNETDIIYEMKIPIFDARYLYSNTDEMMEYRLKVPTDIQITLETDIKDLSKGLLERSELPYAPASTNSNAEIYIATGGTTYIDTALTFNITFTLTPRGYREDNIRSQVIVDSLTAIKEQLTKNELTESSILAAINLATSNEVIGINMDSLFPAGGYVKLVNDFDSFSLRSKLSVESNGLLNIEDAVDISFVSTT